MRKPTYTRPQRPIKPTPPKEPKSPRVGRSTHYSLSNRDMDGVNLQSNITHICDVIANNTTYRDLLQPSRDLLLPLRNEPALELLSLSIEDGDIVLKVRAQNPEWEQYDIDLQTYQEAVDEHNVEMTVYESAKDDYDRAIAPWLKWERYNETRGPLRRANIKAHIARLEAELVKIQTLDDADCIDDEE